MRIIPGHIISRLALGAMVLIGGMAVPGTPARAHATDQKASAGDTPAAGAEHKFVNMDPLTLPVIDGTGVVSNISLAIALDCDEAKADGVKKQLPVLTDAFIQNLYGTLNKHDALRDGVLQVALIKDRLTAITNKVMGAGQVNNVLLQVVSQRPI